MSSLDIQRQRNDEWMEEIGAPKCGICSNWCPDDEMFSCSTCPGQHGLCRKHRDVIDQPCVDWMECCWCGAYLVTAIVEGMFCSQECAERGAADDLRRVCEACEREFHGAVVGANKWSQGFCSLTCWATEHGEGA